MLISIIVFLIVYAAITFELVNKAVATFCGVSILMLLHVIDEHQAIEFIDFETIMLLFGMMIIVSVLKHSGLFTIVSVRISELTRGNPVKILILFSVVTALMSAFLDNVTTVLIIIPIIIELTRGLGLDPKKYVLSQVIISNIGGTATLIGDPPNVIIGSKVGLTFNQFLVNLGPPVIVIFIVVLAFIWATNRDQFKPINTNIIKLLDAFFSKTKIKFTSNFYCVNFIFYFFSNFQSLISIRCIQSENNFIHHDLCLDLIFEKILCLFSNAHFVWQESLLLIHL